MLVLARETGAAVLFLFLFLALNSLSSCFETNSADSWKAFMTSEDAAEAAAATVPLGVSGRVYEPSYLSFFDIRSDLILALAITAAFLGLKSPLRPREPEAIVIH